MGCSCCFSPIHASIHASLRSVTIAAGVCADGRCNTPRLDIQGGRNQAHHQRCLVVFPNLSVIGVNSESKMLLLRSTILMLYSLPAVAPSGAYSYLLSKLSLPPAHLGLYRHFLLVCQPVPCSNLAEVDFQMCILCTIITKVIASMVPKFVRQRRRPCAWLYP